MPEYFVNTRRTEDCTYLVTADSPEEAQGLWESNPHHYDRDVLESREDFDSVDLHEGALAE